MSRQRTWEGMREKKSLGDWLQVEEIKRMEAHGLLPRSDFEFSFGFVILCGFR